MSTELVFGVSGLGECPGYLQSSDMIENIDEPSKIKIVKSKNNK